MALTQARVRELLHYNPWTGIFTWRVRKDVGKKWNTRYAGKKAGCPNGDGYIIISIDKKIYRAHRLVWLYVYGYMPDEVDHDDHNHSNNRIENLNDATRTTNSRNLPRASNNTSGVTGVYWHKGAKKWAVEIWVQRKKHYLGLFDDIDAAQTARISAQGAHGFHNNHGASSDNKLAQAA